LKTLYDEPHVNAIFDQESRKFKAKKILAALNSFVEYSAKSRILDVGSGSGYIANELASSFEFVASIDVTDMRREHTGYEFKLFNGGVFPYPDESFDVVVSNHVIEHVVDQQLHMDEIYRVLRPGGLCYLATPNKLWLTDPHYRLPFLPWLPRRMSTSYVRLVRHMVWDIYPLSPRAVGRIAGSRFQIHNVANDMVKNPDTYHFQTISRLQRFVSHMPSHLVNTISDFAPTLVCVLKKR